ncbi:hypothetical protein CfE428DRAFT_6316 [Chthoniobacter flavus Ellin428]|uniref:Uncharacterized protein n=2 Tax=Chthoniobacter flavus TaxID=191863 RepID=B4DBM5_9BACT|nr:hypothetical protein CfE428DRAFT_6316 [Chthoniobacter flavus Ellin428]
MTLICPRTRRLWAFIAFCALLVVIAVVTHAYVRPLNSDEAEYYAPAIQFVSHSWPQLPLKAYPFPGPPLALWVQAAVAVVFKGWGTVRLLSSLGAVGLAAYLFWRAEDKARWPVLGTLAILTFPFFLWNSFTIKQHAFTVSCLLIGLERWCRAEDAPANRFSGASSAFLTAGVLSNQFCAPLCAALSLDGLWRWRTLSPAERRAIAFCSIPLVFLGLLMLYWGGKQPPAYVDPLPASIVMDWQHRSAQFVLGAVSIGRMGWACPHLNIACMGRPSCWALIPSAALVWLSQIYSPVGSFWTIGQGPISNVLFTALHRVPALLALVAGVLVALAIAFWISPNLKGSWAARSRIWMALYLAVTTIAVPYLFESYYLLLILPLIFVLLRYSETLTAHPRRTSIYLGAVILLGVAYSIFKLRQPI